MPAGTDHARDDEQHEAQAAAHAGITGGIGIAAEGVDAPAGGCVLQYDGEHRRQQQERHDGPWHLCAGDIVDAEIGQGVGNTLTEPEPRMM